ncbi:4Fe-4S binding protein, partial [bacterium]|nr:4Fe-4S binding protein [bacterium]
LEVGAPHRPAALEPAWVAALTARLPGTGFLCGTRSITTAGLDTAAAQSELALAKGLGREGAWPFRVADDPATGAAVALAAPDGSEVEDYALGAALADADRLCVLTPVRPHPHLGLRGALTSLGIGLADREAKIALHRDVRPAVDTPLCAGCGVCMTVCLFDAIRISAGRAYIDHERCTGCGECMNVCFMAGIAPEAATGIAGFQAKVADAAALALARMTGGDPSRSVHFSFLMHLDRQVAATRRRRRAGGGGDIGVLASRDPVALDQAAWDLLADRHGGDLSVWSGFNQLPEALLARAAANGLGERAHRLVTV